MMKIVSFVHAKGNSERVKNKNLQMLGNVPLFVHAILSARNSEKVNIVVIDSDSDEILDIGVSYGAVALKRGKELATNKTTGDDLMYWQASNYPDADIVLQVIPTSPFIRPKSIDGAIDLLINQNVFSVAGVHKEIFYQWSNGVPSYYRNGTIPNSFEMDPLIYETTGLYVNKTSFVLKSKKRLDINNCLPYFLSKIEAIDINTYDDLEFARIVYGGMNIAQH